MLAIVHDAMVGFFQLMQSISLYCRANFPQIGRTAALLFFTAAAGFLNVVTGQEATAPPEDAVAIFSEAQSLHEKNDLSGAIKLYDRALKIVPEFVEAEYQRSVAYLALGDLAEAEKGYRRSLAVRPDWSLAMTGLGSLLVQRGEFAEAEKLLTKVLADEPQSALALIALTEIRLKSKAPHEALRGLLSKVDHLTSKANPLASIWAAQAALEARLGLQADAKASIAKALALDRSNGNALFQLADISIVEGDIVRATDAVRRLEELRADPDAIRLLRARIFAYDRKIDEALNQLDAMTRATAESGELRERITAVRSTNVDDLEKRLAADPTNTALLGRLCSLFRISNPTKARGYCRRAYDLEPHNVDHAVGFGAALVQDRQFEGAVNIFRKILASVPDNATARANLATALFQLKRYPEAKIEFGWLADNQPRSAGAYFFLGIIHDQMGESLDAMANYQQYIRLADPAENKLDIEKVNLRLPVLQKLIKK